MSGKFWTTDEEKELVEMVEDGTPLSAVAKVLGRSSGSCQCKLHTLGITTGRNGRPPNVERMLLIVSLLDAGMSVIGVARRLKVKDPTVFKVVRRLVRMGVLKRTGGATRTCRYKVASWWKTSGRRAETWITWTEEERVVLNPKVKLELLCPER